MIKKLILLSLILLTLFSISTISAAENMSECSLEVPEVTEEISLDNEAKDLKEIKDENDNLLSSGQDDDELNAQNDPVLGKSLEEYLVINDEVRDINYYSVVYLQKYCRVKGNITVDIDGENVYNGRISYYSDIYINDLSKIPTFGMHNLTVSYNGDDEFEPYTKTVPVNFTYYMGFDLIYFDYENSMIIEFCLPKNISTVGLILNDKDYGNITFKDLFYDSPNYKKGSFKVPYDDLKLGSNKIIFKYLGDSYYPSYTSATYNFRISPIYGKTTDYLIDDEEGYFTIRIPVSDTGNFSVYKSIIDEELEFFDSVEVFNGTAKIKIPKSDNFEEGYLLKLINGEDEYNYLVYIYYSQTNTDLIDVIATTNVTFGDNVQVRISNNFDCNVKLNIYIDGNPIMQSKLVAKDFYIISSENLDLSIPYLSPGNHQIVVHSTLNDFDYFSDEMQYVFRKVINITVNEKIDDVLDENIDLTNNTADSNDNLKGNSVSAPIVKSNIISLALKTVNIKKSAKLVLTAALKINGKLAKSKYVVFKFNGKSYKVKTDSKGIAKLTIKNSILKSLKIGKKVSYKVSYLDKTVRKIAVVKK